MQKLLMGRELVGDPDVIIASQPTRGLDVNAVDAIHNLLIDQRNKGSAIFLISEDLDELFKLSHRLLVIFEGKIVKSFNTLMRILMMLVWQWRELMNKYILTKRQVVNELSTFYSFLLGFLIALMIGSIILLIQDKNPVILFLMFKLSIGSVNSLSSSLNKATPLILAGLGIAIINTVKLWNIGAEGQIFMGAIAVNLIYINFQFSNSTSFIFILLVSSFLGGTFCILIPAITKVLFGVNEIITTLLTNYIVIGLTIYLVNGPWKDPDSLNFPAAAYVGKEVYLPNIFGKLSYGF